MKPQLPESWRNGLRPDPFITVSAWSDKYRMLPRRGSSEPGQYRTSRTPYLREIMDKLSPHDPQKRVLMYKPRQIGGTECGINFLFCMTHLYPGPGCLIEPTLDLVKKVTRQKIDPGIVEMPVLRQLIKPARERDSGNTTFFKEAINGALLVMGGANSAAALRAVPLRYLVADEVDAWPHDVGSADGEGGEGDPLTILEKAMTTFPNRKEFILSTPTIKGQSVIDNEYEQSSQGHYEVPCPFCGVMQILEFGNLIFDSKKPTQAEYQCAHCKKMISEKYKTDMLADGRWKHANPDAETYGYHITGLYSPWLTWLDIAKEWIKANYALKVKKNNAKLKTFVNTVLAETWNDDGDSIDRETLHGQLVTRRENYPDNVIPMGAVLIVITGDVQDDRIEMIVKGYGPGMQSWGVAHHVFYGNPAVAGVWEKVSQFILQTWRHESGAILSPHVVFIDSGYLSKQVYEFTKPRFDNHVFATKGANEPKHELISKLSRKNAERAPLFFIGTNEAKNILFRRLIVAEPGPIYMHYNQSFDENYFKQVVLSEKPKWHKGVKIWEKISAKEPNEGLDLECLSLAAAELYVKETNIDLAAEVERLKQEGEKIKPEESEQEEESGIPEQSNNGWISSITKGGWKI